MASHTRLPSVRSVLTYFKPPAVGGLILVGVVAETHDLHRLLAVQVLETGLEVNVQVLVGVVVVHILGHVEVDAADLVDERDEAL